MKHIHLLDPVLEDIMTRWSIPGMGVGIVDAGQIVYARGFGVQSLDTRVPVTPRSIFGIASVSKCFVATAVMQLAERNKVDLDAPVVQYLPYFRLDDERYTQITLRQMLSHTSGMPDMEEDEYEELISHPETDEGAAERFVRGLGERKMIGAPGERFAYSNIAYNVLGDLIAKVSGQTFEEHIKANLLRPTGMADSTFSYPEVPHDRLAVPHLRSPEMIPNPVYPYHRADAPSSFLHTTVEDMCRWCITCLNGGRNDGQHIVSPEGFDLMWTPVASRGYPPYYEDAGLGWTLGHFEGVKTVSHGGMGFGWTDFLILLPELNRAAVILCNEESYAIEQTTQALVDVMLDRVPQAGSVSWMAPVSQALQAGGIQAAYDCYHALKESSGEAYSIDADDLLPLVYQLVTAGNTSLAIEVLELNLHAFPEHVDSLHFLARLLLRIGERARAEEALQTAIALRPDSRLILDLLETIRRRPEQA